MNAKEPAVALYALGKPGAMVCRRLAPHLHGAQVFLPERHAHPDKGERAFQSLPAVLAQKFSLYSGHVLVCAAGMAVRCIAPLIKGKDRDPGVVVVDQCGRFAVSLLSGHLGGANRLAQQVAEILGGQPVITTATDNLALPSLEIEARRLGLAVENLSALAGVSAALIDRRQMAVQDPGNWLGLLLAEYPALFHLVHEEEAESLKERPLVWVNWQALALPDPWLVLRPRCLALGMGCNRRTSAGEIIDLAHEALAQAGASAASLKLLASAEAKREEPGLLEAARELGVTPVFFSHESLAQVEVPNPSETVRRNLGTGSVCEAAALLASDQGRLILPKVKSKNATAAVAII